MLDQGSRNIRGFTAISRSMQYFVDLDLICHVLRKLAIEHWERFEHLRERKELDSSISHARIEVGLCPKRHPNRYKALSNLGKFLFSRFETCGTIEDLEEAIELHNVALELNPKGHPDRSKLLNLLAISLFRRFEQHGQTNDLNETIKLHYTALKLRPEGHPDRFRSLDNLATSLQARFIQHGRIEDLNEAVDLHRRAVELLPKGYPSSQSNLNNLAASLNRRFEQSGRIEDLSEAIDIYRSALSLLSKRDPYYSSTLNNLANSLQVRFKRCRRVEDLDEAIDLHHTALDLCPKDHQDHFMILDSLALYLHTRFGHYGRTEDLDGSIELHRSALKLRPIGHLDRFMSLFNFASSLRDRFELHRRMEDLNEAIELHRAALELRPKNHPERAMPLNGLATSLLSRFEQKGQTEDLEEAIELNRTALELLPDDHAMQDIYLNELAISLRTRFELYRRTKDLEEAIQLHRSTLRLHPEGQTGRSTSLPHLAHALFCRFSESGLMDDFEECIQLLKRSTESKFSSSVVRLDSAIRWVYIAQSQSHRTTSRAYKTAMLLLQRAVTVNPGLPAQLNFLNQQGNYKFLALEAVAFAIEEDQLEDAIEILEQGRCLLWSQMHGFRASLDELTETNKELAEKFKDVSRQLENLATSSTVPQYKLCITPNESPVLDANKEWNLFDKGLKLKRQLSDEQDEIINKIRLIPGFESFLAATPFRVLQRAASEGPVIVVNHCKYRSDALILLAREDLPVVCVPLDGEFHEDSIATYTKLLVTRKYFTASSPKYDEVLRQSMKMLWDRVVSKIVRKLQELGINEGSRIWWCPTSVLSALPFHAAGPFEDSDGTAKYLLDKYISSYTPTLGALIKARSGGNGEEPTVLVVGDTSLPSANREISNIRNCGISTKLLLKKATCDAVIKALWKTTWVHFVCHGNLDPAPFGSSFKLSDRRLTLLDIVQAHLPNAEFAYLSACHTAEQPLITVHDEALHLAAAIQFSGFRSVIGSMWELLDEDGPFFARSVYEYMWDCDEGEARHKRAAEGLRRAAVELKAREGIQTDRWVNLIHIGA